MTDERNEHIDQFFREHFHDVDVSYNPAHWDQLSQALAAAAATGAMASSSLSAWQRLVHFVKHYHNVLLLSLFSIILIGVTFLLTRNDVVLPSPSASPLEQLNSVSPVFVSDSIYENAPQRVKDSLRKAGVVAPTSLDTLTMPLDLTKDTIDTLRVDSLKGFLFW